MPLNPPPTIQNHLCLARTLLTHSASPRSSEITYAVDSGATGLSAQALANTLQGDFAEFWSVTLDVEVVIGPTFVILGDGTSVPAVATSSVGTTNGTYSANTLPPNNNALIKKTTGLGGRKNRGRMFMPWCFNESDVNEVGILTPTAVAGVQAQAALWLADLAAVPLPLVIENRTFNQPLPPHYVTHIGGSGPVTSLVVEGLIASQRRRIGR